MNDPTKKRLADMFGKYERRLSQEEEQREQEKSDEDRFLEGFKKRRQETIRPIMEDIGKTLREQGHDYRIEEQEYRIDPRGRSRDASIKLEVYRRDIPRSEYGSEQKPGVEFSANIWSKTGYAHHGAIVPGAGGSSGRSGEHTLEYLSRDAVEREIVAGLEKIFSAVSRYSGSED